MAMPVTTEEVKAFLQITDTTHDAIIALLIPEVTALAKAITHNPMSVTDEDGVTTDDYPDGIKKAVSEMIRYEVFVRGKDMASSESLGDYSITYDFRNSNGYPEKILGLLAPFKKIRFV